MNDRYLDCPDKLAVKVNGLLIEDATIRVGWYHIEDGPSVDVEFSGTIAVFAQNWLDAVEAARLSHVEFVDGFVSGTAQNLSIEVTGEMVMVPSGRGKSMISTST